MALVLLELGGLVIPVVGWAIGVVLVWTSRTWSTAQKWAATLVVPGGLGAAVLAWMFLPAERTCIIAGSGTISLPLKAGCVNHGLYTPMWVRLLVAALLAAAPLLTSFTLWRTSRTRRLRHEHDSVN